MINRILSFLLFIGMIFIGCDIQQSADIILIIPSYTMNADQPWAEAVVIKNNKIIFVGNKKEALLFKNSLTRLINNPNGMVLPGFIDSHVHLLWGGIEMSECQLNDLETEEQIFHAIQDYIDLYPDKKWIRGSGWALPIFSNGNPRKEWLDKISPNKPVYLLSADGHSAWVNSKALALAGINEKTNDPPNGIIERDPKSKEPSGVLREDAMELVYSLFPSYTQDEFDNGLQVAIKEASRFGIT
ncbi:MAG: amidohydrolase family protein, partial [Candidatus Neomarinimicrobiota bacterium]|nr:amidohydrolase family protein [Candidatus Neomarinimicrobiota bacterium]